MAIVKFVISLLHTSIHPSQKALQSMKKMKQLTEKNLRIQPQIREESSAVNLNHETETFEIDKIDTLG